MAVRNLRTLYFSILSMLLCLVSTTASADTYSDQWGPAIGDSLPLLEASDHTGSTRSFGDLKGKNGLLLFMNRSADW